MSETIRFKLNSKPLELPSGGERMLLWVLRTDLGMTGTKYGCGEALCGACTVLVNGEPVRSCQYPLNELSGKEVITIEGLAGSGDLHPLQKAFIENDALQCGYCTPGMIIQAYGLLLRNPNPTRREVVEGMNDNLCRCGAHSRILGAIEAAALEMRGGKK